MNRTIIGAVILLFCLAGCSSQTAKVPDAASQPPLSSTTPPESKMAARVRDLIDRLGDDAFEKREAAQEELIELDKAALPQLQEAAESSADPEVRMRCKDTIEIISLPTAKKSVRAVIAALSSGDEARLKMIVTDNAFKILTSGGNGRDTKESRFKSIATSLSEAVDHITIKDQTNTAETWVASYFQELEGVGRALISHTFTFKNVGADLKLDGWSSMISGPE